MEIGIAFAALSALSLALTMVIDRLLMEDLYEGNPRLAWFVSSTLGATFGLISTLLAGALLFDIAWTEAASDILVGTQAPLAWQMALSGVLASVTLRSYFGLFAHHRFTTSIALAVTATPIFVFAAQALIAREPWTAAASASVFVTIVGLLGFEALSQHEDEPQDRVVKWRLPVFIILSTIYIVFTDNIVDLYARSTNYGPGESALMLMPFYWMGFSFGILELCFKSTRSWCKKVSRLGSAVKIIVAMEVIGFSFYFFEIIGFSRLSATLTALVIGCDAFIVWLFDRYIQARFRRARQAGESHATIAMFKISIDDFDLRDPDKKTKVYQISFIIVTLAGIAMWPF